MKELIRAVSRRLGYDFVSTTLRWKMSHVLDFVAQRLQPRSVVDIGVADGTPPLYQAFPNARYIFVDPLKEFESNLKFLAEKYSGRFALAYAGAREGTKKIKVHREILSSSSAYGLDWVIGEREVPVVTIDSLHQGFSGPTVIKLDCQGAEIEALEGAQRVLEDTELVIAEVTFFHFWGGQARVSRCSTLDEEAWICHL